MRCAHKIILAGHFSNCLQDFERVIDHFGIVPHDNFFIDFSLRRSNMKYGSSLKEYTYYSGETSIKKIEIGVSRVIATGG